MEGQHGFDKHHARERAKYCKDVKRVADKKIHETAVLEAQRAERLAEIVEKQKMAEVEKAMREVMWILIKNCRIL